VKNDLFKKSEVTQLIKVNTEGGTGKKEMVVALPPCLGKNYTRFECSLRSSLVPSVDSQTLCRTSNHLILFFLVLV
jgi:hypothetical protein